MPPSEAWARTELTPRRWIALGEGGGSLLLGGSRFAASARTPAAAGEMPEDNGGCLRAEVVVGNPALLPTGQLAGCTGFHFLGRIPFLEPSALPCPVSCCKQKQRSA